MEFQLDTDNKEFQDALQLITHTRQSVFLTGKAGTGKSTFLKYICAHTKKKYVVLAPTGIAAINAEGVTLHSFFKLPFRPMLPDDPDLSLKNGRIFEFFKYRKEVDFGSGIDHYRRDFDGTGRYHRLCRPDLACLFR